MFVGLLTNPSFKKYLAMFTVELKTFKKIKVNSFHAIIVNVIDLSKITKIIIKSHIKNILVEKPVIFLLNGWKTYLIQKKENGFYYI